MKFRNATYADLNAISEIENLCFPSNEAATKESFSKRLNVFSNHFWIMEENNEILGFINGMITDNETINDEMFEVAELHDEKGKWQAIFGLAVSPKFQKKGYAGKLITHIINESKKENKKGVTLTCKENLIDYYKKWGFEILGISKSVHGGEVWYDMTITFY